MTVEDAMKSRGLDPGDYVELKCDDLACGKPLIASPVGDNGTLRFDQCPCGHPVPDLTRLKARLFFFTFGQPVHGPATFWALIHRDDVRQVSDPLIGA